MTFSSVSLLGGGETVRGGAHFLDDMTRGSIRKTRIFFKPLLCIISRDTFRGSRLIDVVLTAFFEIRNYDSGVYL
jgi:hypothetical protein